MGRNAAKYEKEPELMGQPHWFAKITGIHGKCFFVKKKLFPKKLA
ncbi:MAG: hypothetical protein JWR44_2349 [Hymenobacter sp.]|jgi:hypothetical protein|nr:hypothetical protein [Hymenobacter sp.]